MARILPPAVAADRFPTAQAVVADRLRRAVLSGLLAPGTRLLQAAVAAEMRMSTTPVREAMRELAGEGLLDLDPHRGVVVHQPSVAEFQEVYRIRGLLEPVAIAATVENITATQIANAEWFLEQMEREADVAEWTILNVGFHSLLAEATGMPILTSILVKLRYMSALYIASVLHLRPDAVVTANAEHRAMLEACKAGDVPKALTIEIDHLRHTLAIGEEQLTARGSGKPAATS